MYASMELFLDILHSVRILIDIDFESIAIYLCVAEATMRPVIANHALVERLGDAEVAPEDVRGSITMLLVSDRLGLPRETVRRKVKQLIAAGMLYEDDKGRVRSTPNFDNPNLAGAVKSIDDAVRRYHQRLAEHGITD
jgi:hypothetical protein